MQETEEISSITDNEIDKAVISLKKGRVLLYPSDTIWGLGCDITNVSAVARVYEIKNRPSTKPFILLVDSIDMLKRYIKMIHPRVETLLMHHKQPLTIIYEASQAVPDHLIPESDTIAIRVTHDPFCKSIISRLDQALISTSANTAGHPYPTTYDEIEEVVISMADDIVDRRLEKEASLQTPSVLATFNKKGELDFIRL